MDILLHEEGASITVEVRVGSAIASFPNLQRR